MRKKRQAGSKTPKNTHTFYNSWTLQTVPVQMKRGLQNYRGHSQATWVKCASLGNSWFVRQSTPITACTQHTQHVHIWNQVVHQEEQLWLPCAQVVFQECCRSPAASCKSKFSSHLMHQSQLPFLQGICIHLPLLLPFSVQCFLLEFHMCHGFVFWFVYFTATELQKHKRNNFKNQS